MARALLVICVCIIWSVAAVAEGNWFVFELGDKKAQICSFLDSHPNYHVVTPKKCPDLDDNPTIEVVEETTSQTFHVEAKEDVVKGVKAGSNKIKSAIAPEQPVLAKTHTIRLVFKNDRLIAMWMTFPSDYYQGIYERVRKKFQNPKIEQGFALDPLWQDKAPHEIGEKPTNWIVVFVKGITRVYLVRYNKVQDGIMTGWVGLDSRTQDEPR